MILNIVILIVSLAAVVFGADWLVEGASGIARKAGVSEFVIGLTIVGFGTSCPELVVSITGAFNGNADISVGNVIGSNIFNVNLILGLTALLSPIAITASNRRRDIPITLLVSLLFVVLGFGYSLFGLGEADVLSRIEGVVFLAVFAAYLYLCFKYDEGAPSSVEGGSEQRADVRLVKAIGLTLLGLVGLIVGGHYFVDSAVKIASSLGVSDKFIAITLLAGGTSLPELVTSVVAVIKGRNQLALGNILGSNVFNILLILGCASVITPLSLANVSFVDVGVFVASIVLLWIFTLGRKGLTLGRFKGLLLLLVFIAYYVYLFRNAQA